MWNTAFYKASRSPWRQAMQQLPLPYWATPFTSITSALLSSLVDGDRLSLCYTSLNPGIDSHILPFPANAPSPCSPASIIPVAAVAALTLKAPSAQTVLYVYSRQIFWSFQSDRLPGTQTAPPIISIALCTAQRLPEGTTVGDLGKLPVQGAQHAVLSGHSETRKIETTLRWWRILRTSVHSRFTENLSCWLGQVLSRSPCLSFFIRSLPLPFVSFLSISSPSLSSPIDASAGVFHFFFFVGYAKRWGSWADW